LEEVSAMECPACVGGIEDARSSAPHASCRIRLLLNGLAMTEKGAEGLDLIKQQAIVDHVLVVTLLQPSTRRCIRRRLRRPPG